MYNTLSSNFSS